MSLIIAARFDTFDHAKTAADALMRNGVHSDDMHTFFVNPAGAHARLPMGGDRMADPGSKGAPFGALGGAALFAVVGAVVGALIGFSMNNAMLPILVGAGLGAYVGSMIGGVSRLGKNQRTASELSAREVATDNVENQPGRPAGVLLAVRVDAVDQQRVSDLLRQSGGIEIERAQGRWEEGQWRDFDPLDTPDLQQKPVSDVHTPTDRANNVN